MKICIKLTSPTTEMTSAKGKKVSTVNLRFRFNSWDLYRDKFSKDEYSVNTLSYHDKHLLVSPILNFYRRCSKINIERLNFRVSKEFQLLRISRCDKLMNAGRMTFEQYRTRYAYKYPGIYKGQLKNV